MPGLSLRGLHDHGAGQVDAADFDSAFVEESGDLSGPAA
jgi:hypothetical protein